MKNLSPRGIHDKQNAWDNSRLYDLNLEADEVNLPTF